MNQAGIKDDDSRKSVPNTITKDNEDDDNSSNKDIHILPRGRSQSITSTASTTTTSSITSLFESSLSLLGSLPVATSISSSSSSNKPILYNSKYNGIFKLYLNSSVENSDEIQLQSHLLWPSSPKLAELIEENEGKHAHAIEDNNSSSSDNCHIGIKGERGKFPCLQITCQGMGLVYKSITYLSLP